MIEENTANKHPLGLYIHIPFCVKKCDYCDFLSAPATQEMKTEYIDALLKEINSYLGRTSKYCVSTIFIGGGTPSCIAAEDIARVMEALRHVFTINETELEATIEVNPGTITEDKLNTYRKAGINRLSFGLQSTHNEELRCLGRIHTYEDFAQNYELARRVGFSNINIDLMSALPGQTLNSWEKTLKAVTELRPEHISAYSLIIEEGTEFYHLYRPGAAGEDSLPDEETDRRIYYRTKELLAEYGYHRYEISNYARSGFESRHNNSYWIGSEYLGLGLGAASLIEAVRFSNLSEINEYIVLCSALQYKNTVDNNLDTVDTRINPMLSDEIGLRKEYQQLTKEQRMEEFMFLGLRRCEGISRQEFKQRFSVDINEIYGKVLTELEKKKLITIMEENIRLTEYGIDISNVVLAEFLID